MSLVNTITMPPFPPNTTPEYGQISSDGTNVWTAALLGPTLYKIPCNNPLNPTTVLNYTNCLIGGVSSDGTNVWVSYSGPSPNYNAYLLKIRCIDEQVVSTIDFGSSYSSYSIIATVSSDGTNVWVVFRSDTSFVFKVDCASATYNPTPIFVGNRASGISSDGTNVWVANTNSNSITQIDCSTGSVVTTISTGIYPLPLAISSDGVNVWVTYGDIDSTSGYFVIDCLTSSIIHSVTGSKYYNISGISSNGTFVYISNYNEIIILDAITFNTLITINSNINGSFTISFDGTFAWATNFNTQVYQISAPIITNYIVNGIGDLCTIFNQYTTPIKPLQLLEPTNLVLPISTISAPQYLSCIANSTGQYIYVWSLSILYNSSKSILYFSSNYGETFNQVSLNGQTQGAYNYFMVDISNSGQYAAVSAINSSSIASIFISSNYGQTFNNVVYPAGQPTGTLYISFATSVSINDYGLFLCSIGYTYISPGAQISIVWYSNDVTINPSNPTWYQQISKSTLTVNDPIISFAVISDNSTNISIPEFMIATNNDGIHIYNSSTQAWILSFSGNFTFGYPGGLCRINSDGSVAVVSSSNTATIPSNNSLYYISTNATTTSPTWLQIPTFPELSSIGSFNFDINSLGNVIVCLPNSVPDGATKILASYDNGITWNTIYTSISIAELILNNIFCYGANELTSTGQFFNQPPSGTAPIVIGTFENLQTKFLTNSGQDLGYLFIQQMTNPGSNYIVTNFIVQNYTPAWTTVTGTYDLGQIFQPL